MDYENIELLESIQAEMKALSFDIGRFVGRCEPKGQDASNNLFRLSDIAQYLDDNEVAVREILEG